MTYYEDVKEQLLKEPKTWLITGVAGFIGSNILEQLLILNQHVVGLDNLATGYQHNLEEVKNNVSSEQWKYFTFIEGDICNLETCAMATQGVDYVLHQAALGSVPRSIELPINTNNANINGFLNMLVASRDSNVKNFVYAASSSTYGDHPDLPKVEDKIGNPLSPYAVTKLVNELYAKVFYTSYGFNSIGLRYFNVFGRRQDPNGAYAAVIPKWVAAMIKNEEVFINGDGETSRDFCYIDNAVQMNILAATTTKAEALNQIYNTAINHRTSLNELYTLIQESLSAEANIEKRKASHRDFRKGDVRHSQADISKAQRLLNYQPSHNVQSGLQDIIPWYLKAVQHNS